MATRCVVGSFMFARAISHVAAMAAARASGSSQLCSRGNQQIHSLEQSRRDKLIHHKRFLTLVAEGTTAMSSSCIMRIHRIKEVI